MPNPKSFGVSALKDPAAEANLARLRSLIHAWLSAELCGTNGSRILPPGGPRSTPLLPVARLLGSPAERAGQFGFMLRPILRDTLDVFIEQAAPTRKQRLMLRAALFALDRKLPASFRTEIRALAEVAGVRRSELTLLNIAGDMHVAQACSTAVVRPPLADTNGADGAVLFARNLDFIGFGLSDATAMIIAHRPAPGSAEIPYASLGWTGLWNVYTGWNAAGLCLGNMQAYNGRPPKRRGIRALFSGGTPTAWAYTRILRECRSVDEAVRLVETLRPLSATNLMLADAGGGAAWVQWGLDRMHVQRFENGVANYLYSTNYFVDENMTDNPPDCWRMKSMENFLGGREREIKASGGATEQVGVEDLKTMLNAVNQGPLTLHSVVFEPWARRLHIAAGAPPSSGGNWATVGWDVWREP